MQARQPRSVGGRFSRSKIGRPARADDGAGQNSGSGVGEIALKKSVLIFAFAMPSARGSNGGLNSAMRPSRSCSSFRRRANSDMGVPPNYPPDRAAGGGLGRVSTFFVADLSSLPAIETYRMARTTKTAPMPRGTRTVVPRRSTFGRLSSGGTFMPVDLSYRAIPQRDRQRLCLHENDKFMRTHSGKPAGAEEVGARSQWKNPNSIRSRMTDRGTPRSQRRMGMKSSPWAGRDRSLAGCRFIIP